jgi:hypothetical protein
MEDHTQVQKFVEFKDQVEAFDEEDDSVGESFLYNHHVFVTVLNAPQGGVGSSDAFHSAEPDAELGVVRDDFEAECFFEFGHVRLEEY